MPRATGYDGKFIQCHSRRIGNQLSDLERGFGRQVTIGVVTAVGSGAIVGAWQWATSGMWLEPIVVGATSGAGAAMVLLTVLRLIRPLRRVPGYCSRVLAGLWFLWEYRNMPTSGEWCTPDVGVLYIQRSNLTLSEEGARRLFLQFVNTAREATRWHDGHLDAVREGALIWWIKHKEKQQDARQISPKA